ncbi:ATP-dependent RNA helicase [Cichlidogyrus casuarinus]|uniref:ATP-dependent RNA helicase n=1 Tax=Cichlidogyrus casuarinus TaxID=1844966 RepID=A0ABD2Q8M9_9PLAT
MEDDDLVLNIMKPEMKKSVKVSKPAIRTNQLISTNPSYEYFSGVQNIRLGKKSQKKIQNEEENNIKKESEMKSITTDQTRENGSMEKTFKPIRPRNLSELLKDQVESRIEPLFSTIEWKNVSDLYGIHPHLTVLVTSRLKLEKLTSIQSQTLEPLSKGRDALIKAQTGSGKTLSYAIPLFSDLMKIEPPVNRQDGPLALILLPTRELAQQTASVFSEIRYSRVPIVSGLLQGGQKRKQEKALIRKGMNVIISTPQRFLDHLLQTASLKVHSLRWLVIDEADRLTEMNFEKDVKEIVSKISQAKRESSTDPTMHALTTVLVSATLTPKVKYLADLALRDPVNCEANSEETLKDAKVSDCALPEGLTHLTMVTPCKQRLVALASFILLKCRYNDESGKVVIFFSTQNSVDFHYGLFTETLCATEDDLNFPGSTKSLKLYRLHGNMKHKERQNVFSAFSQSAAGVLMTTDVASRGLDLAGVAWVVIYQICGTPVDYVHRVGRTARAGGKGKALLMLLPEEKEYASLLHTRYGINFEEIPLDDVLDGAKNHMKNLKQVPGVQNHMAMCRTGEEAAVHLSLMFLHCVEHNDALHELGEEAFLSFLRAYASLTGEMRSFFTFKRLHLGHMAKAFCLKETPSDIASKVTGKHMPANGKPIRGGKRQKIEEKVTEPLFENQPERGGNHKLAWKHREDSNSRRDFIPRVRKVAPSELAKKNMLAEFGL